MPDDRLGEVGIAYVVPRPNVAVDPDEIIEWCREEMANYKVPRAVEIVDALPLNASGKVLEVRVARAGRGAIRDLTLPSISAGLARPSNVPPWGCCALRPTTGNAHRDRRSGHHRHDEQPGDAERVRRSTPRRDARGVATPRRRTVVQRRGAHRCGEGVQRAGATFPVSSATTRIPSTAARRSATHASSWTPWPRSPSRSSRR